MQSKKQTEAEIVSLSGLGGIVETYKEIAATRITRTRTSVLKSHNFLGEINTVYEQVKSSYRRRLEQIIKAKKEKNAKNLSFVTNNGKTALIFLSSNTGLYGDIIHRTFNLFLDEINGSDRASYDIAVVGRLGLFLVEEAKIPQPYQYFDFPDQAVPEGDIIKITNFLIQYEKVVVFYQEFKTLMKQQPVASDISGNVLDLKKTTDTPSTSSVKYLFEPSLEKVLEFFEKEIFASIFEQTVRDSQLAKFASRLVTLDSASQNIRKKLLSSIAEDVRLRHREKNRKQSQTFSSMSLWT